MKRTPNLQLRQIGKKYMIVNADSGTVNVTEVFTLNSTAARLWEHIGENEFTADDVVKWLCETYDVDCDTARKDAEALLNSWREYGLIK